MRSLASYIVIAFFLVVVIIWIPITIKQASKVDKLGDYKYFFINRIDKSCVPCEYGSCEQIDYFGRDATRNNVCISIQIGVAPMPVHFKLGGHAYHDGKLIPWDEYRQEWMREFTFMICHFAFIFMTTMIAGAMTHGFEHEARVRENYQMRQRKQD